MTGTIKSPLKKGAGSNNSFPPNKPKKSTRPGGFSYSVSWEQIEEYRSWPYERRLQWLMMGNRLRKFLPRKTIEIQDAFRQGII
jgi:hypothetical protein